MEVWSSNLRPWKVAVANMPMRIRRSRIRHLNANLGGANGGIENCVNFADRAGHCVIGVGVQTDIGSLARHAPWANRSRTHRR